MDLSCATNNIDNADKAKTLSQVSLVVAVFGGGLAIYEASKGSKAAFPKYLDGMSLRGNGEKIMLRKTWRW
ncbi:MAG: hypothetical protein HAW59_06065 [Betaproteobacteria bacterium]|nr:hypothetical protein [Betaproteobacteria bacterium]